MRLSAVVYQKSERLSQAQSLAQQFLVPLYDGQHLQPLKGQQYWRALRTLCRQADPFFVFVLDEMGLHLSLIETANQLAIRADFHHSSVRYRRDKGGGRNELIAKALGLKSGYAPQVLDATAGLGADAFVLASLGCQLRMLERVPEIRCLVQAALMEAQSYADQFDPTLCVILNRMQLVSACSHQYLDQLEGYRPEIIYLDPMFPEPRKRSLVKKEMQVLQALVGADSDADLLLERARNFAQKRVVVKRPKIAPFLAEQKPDFQVLGKSNRYDVYLKRPSASEHLAHATA
jgi:16S rRNA (guanine1516-N2)-methyltransferase